MEEYVDIWDDDGSPTGKIALKSEAHNMGWFHPTVHIWFYTRKGEILLQRRAKHKDTFPGMWDVSVAGHLSAGEVPSHGAVREIREEIGLAVSTGDLIFSGVEKAVHNHPGGLLDCEFHHIYLAELKHDISELILQESEVAELRLEDISILQTGICKWDPEESMVPHGKAYYEKIAGTLRLLL